MSWCSNEQYITSLPYIYIESDFQLFGFEQPHCMEHFGFRGFVIDDSQYCQRFYEVRVHGISLAHYILEGIGKYRYNS